MFLPPVLFLEAFCHTPEVVYIQAAMSDTHSGGYAWSILARSMTQVEQTTIKGETTGGTQAMVLALMDR